VSPLPEILAAPAPQAVFRALPGARAVGGCVRDVLAGLEVHDLDMAAPFPPEEIAARLARRGFRVFETGLAHGTVTALLDGAAPIEVTSLRRDVATDGRHAAVAWTTDWHEDAARRDFSINAMSMDAEGRLHDHHRGVEDLRAGRVASWRAGHPPRRGLPARPALLPLPGPLRPRRPDPPRRAIRAACPASRALAERVWSELKRLLPRPTRARPGLMSGWACCRRPARGRQPAASPRAGQPTGPAAGGPAAVGTDSRPGRPPAPVREESARLRALHATDGARLPRPEACAVSRPHRRARTPRHAREIARIAAAEHPERDLSALFALPHGPAFPLLGRDALALGLPPGPRLGRLLDAAREWWIEHGGDREACLARLRELAATDAG
jgi:poly(A) polymerase/tRNA nucleotidyltransferase (CCA-adding enzyme)